MNITVTKHYRAEIGHRLMDYEGKCAHLHGHSYLFEVTATAPELDDRDMVVDFKDLKTAMKAVLEPYDHALVLRADDPLLEVLGGDHSVYRSARGESARLFLWDKNPTAEAMAGRFARLIQNELPGDITVVHVRVWETATSHADWRKA